MMYGMLLNLWVTGKATETTINNAVAKRWITQAQADMILATPQEPLADPVANAAE